ncbi:MAG: FTR1 family iron permease [Tumebacillaceae bacterium]
MARHTTTFTKWVRTFRAGLVFLLLLTLGTTAWASSTESPSDTLLPVVGDALVKARAHDYKQVAQDLQQFEQDWKTILQDDKQITADEKSALEQALAGAKASVQGTAPNGDAVSTSLTALAKATNGLAASASTKAPATASNGKKDMQSLSAFLQKTLAAVQKQDWTEAKSQYKQFEEGWPHVEADVRSENFTVYSNIEIKMSQGHVAVNADTPDQQKATDALQSLQQVITDYVSGKTVATTEPTAADNKSVADLLQLLDQATKSLQANDAATAANTMQTFIQTWPSVEGQVSVKSPAAYTSTETNMTQALQLLSSSTPDVQKAQQVIEQMKSTLEPYAAGGDYTAFDAGMVLFREGLEALLVVSALLAFLNRTGNREKQSWIWGGIGAGLLVSAVLATVMTLFFSSITGGNNREMIEGVTGLVAVVMMFTVGVWLHSKSNGKAWNQYIQRQMGSALARGSLISLSLVSFLAIVREGAETIIFYLGMASSIDKSQLLLGIGGALVVLLILGFVIIRFSVRLPLKPFFLVASLFIYYIAFKFLGQSIHVLQIVDWIPAHTATAIPTIEWLGVYPTWETFGLQVVLLVLILGSVVWTNRKASSMQNKIETARQ